MGGRYLFMQGMASIAGAGLLGAAAGVGAQPVSATLVAPFQESVQEEVKVSGTVIVGVASTGVLDGAVLMRGFVVPGESSSVCLTVRSRDGVYFSRNEFEVPGGVPAGATGIVLSLDRTKHQTLLTGYHDDDVAVAATSGACGSGDETWLVPRTVDGMSETVDVLVNGFGATAVFYATASGGSGDCTEFVDGRRTSYDFRCRVPRGQLDGGKQKIRIERERYGRPLPGVSFDVALAPLP